VLPLDADLLDHKLNQERTPRGTTIVQGIEYDARGCVVQYHLLTRHPSEGVTQGHRPVSPDRLLYIAERTRPQQARGVTRLAPIMTTVEHLDRLAEALVVLNRVTAAKMGALIPGELAEPLEDDDDDGPPVIEQAPAEWWTLPRGYDVKMLDPGQPTAEFDAFQRFLVQSIAAGLGVSYEALSGNYKGATYSSARQALLLERDGWMADQGRFIASIMVPLFREWLRWAQLRRVIALPSPHTPRSVAARSVFHARRWPWIDPKKDAEAVDALVKLGLTSRTREANKQGLSFDELVAELEREHKAMVAAGLVPAAPAPGTPTPATPAPAPRDEDDAEDDDGADDDDDSEA
jgi:lambda family phage portal protein